MKRFAILLAAALALLTACQPAPSEQRYPLPSFRNKASINIDGSAIQLRDEGNGKSQSNTALPVSPVDAIKSWASDRVRAAGQDGRIEVIISEAYINETPLAVKDGFAGFFTDEQAARYDGAMRVTVRLYKSDSNIAVAEASGAVTRTRTVAEKDTIQQREEAKYQMVKEMITALDGVVEKNIYTYFQNHLR